MMASDLVSLELYQLVAESSANVFFSPASISICLGMVKAGAVGPTRQEINKVLTDKHVEDLIGWMEKQLNASSESAGKTAELYFANKAVCETSRSLLDSYINILKTSYNAEISQADFVNNPERERLAINEWVSDKTVRKINDVLPPNSIDTLTRMILINCIYFKGLWKIPFDPSKTISSKFHVTPSQSTNVNMMCLSQARLKYASADNYQIVVLPYKGVDDVTMTLIVPQKLDGISAVEKDLSRALELIPTAKTASIDVHLPRFSLTQSINLKSVLEKLGIKTVFSDAADLSGIDGSRDLYISEVYHKAFVDVNEQGTEAAAATAAVIGLLSLPLCVRCDRPFLFVIRQSTEMLFIGRLSNPSSGE